MAVTADTVRAAAGLRIRIDTTVDATTATLIRAWAGAWNVLVPEWLDALEDGATHAGDDRRAWARWARTERARRALTATADALQQLAAEAGGTISGALPAVLEQTQVGHAAVLATQMPPGGVDWARVDPRALDAIVRRTTRQITARTRPISRDATRAIRQELVRGIASGRGPRQVAALMVERTRGRFDGGLTRALVIARTELLDAHRAAALEADKAASDVLTGWRWTCEFSVRTCPACLARHGTTHPITQPGPQGHPACRCVRTPVTKTWAELGLDIPDPPDQFPDARAWYQGLPDTDQVRIMGAARRDLLASGQTSWDDLATLRPNPDWRPSWQVTPVRDLRPA